VLRRFCYLAILCLIAACSPQLSPTPEISTPFPTNAAPLVPQTLPPTWTPTFTPTPLPPTVTPTITPTPSPIPTASAEDICAGFKLLHDFDTGKPYPWNGAITFYMTSTAPEVVIRFVAIHRSTGENQGAQFPGGQTIIAELPASLLPHPGLYDWKLSIHSEKYGDLCKQEGTFVVLRPEATAEATTEVTPEAMPEATAEATSEAGN
jgi:hypothetical protein